MIALRLTPRARNDLDGIWDHTAEEWGVDQAEVYLQAIRQTLGLLHLNPRLGRDVSDVRPGYFKFPTASHVIYYKMTTNRIDVIRILHKSMDVNRHL